MQVFNFLTAQSKDIATYGTNPLWQTVDGPWKLNQYQSDGYVQFKANPAYSGPDTHAIQYFVEEPFTTDTAELDVLRSGSTLDYGYLPFQDSAQQGTLDFCGLHTKRLERLGYHLLRVQLPQSDCGADLCPSLFPPGHCSPWIPLNEHAYIKGPLNGFGVTSYLPVPCRTDNLCDTLRWKGPSPVDPAKAVSMLKSHGWDVKPGGVSTCASPGSGPTNCGAGIKAGAKLEINLNYQSGNVSALGEEMQGLKSDFTAAGIDINLGEAPSSTRSSPRPRPALRARGR